ncbi:hypothetical protein IT399_03875 [Candidatus Nomurabacteria bacterium]|nr:hypothetical protein [Candidatus Nomurabacteria bacterium]
MKEKVYWHELPFVHCEVDGQILHPPLFARDGTLVLRGICRKCKRHFEVEFSLNELIGGCAVMDYLRDHAEILSFVDKNKKLEKADDGFLEAMMENLPLKGRDN